MEPLGIALCLSITILLAFAAPSKGPDVKTEATRLVRLFRQGDKKAFDRIVLLLQDRIYNLTLNYVKQAEEAQDLTQDIFVTAYRALPSLKDDTKFVAWLYQIAVNHCRNRYSRLQRRGFFNSLSIDEPDMPLHLASEDQPQRNVEQGDLFKAVLNAMDTLNESDREILQLRDLQELSYEEISQVLKLPLGTVKSKLNRARIKLKNKLRHLL